MTIHDLLIFIIRISIQENTVLVFIYLLKRGRDYMTIIYIKKGTRSYVTARQCLKDSPTLCQIPQFDWLGGRMPCTHQTLWLILIKVFCTSGPNLVTLDWMGGELWCGQAQNGENFDFHVELDLEGQSRSVQKTIGALTKVFCIFGPNLVILAWTGPELSQTDRHTHTDAGNDNTRRPKLASGKNVCNYKT